MTTIKSFTDISQSKKLAEFLPIESADMCYMYLGTENKEYEDIPICAPAMEGDLCAWSFAALFNVLPDGTNIIKDEADTENEKYMCTVGVKNDILSTFSDNPVDACVAMIEKLYEHKMLLL